MALIAPFRGLRYNPEKISSMENVVSPPYDVINNEAQDALLNKDPYNMIRLDLGKKTSGGEEDNGRYLESRAILEEWEKGQVLVRDEQPSFYLYYIEYAHPSGRRLTRKGLVALAGLAEFSEGIVKPHEKTFRGVVSDRLRLLETCGTQFSQIFSLYSDPAAEIMDCLEAVRPEAPLYTAKDLDGGLHSFFAVSEPQALAKVQELFRDKSLYIADGHHRYTTALQLRENKQQETGGPLPIDSPFNNTMMYLCPMEDLGLSVLPTHRLARLPEGHGLDAVLERLAGGFEVQEVKGGSREVLLGETLAGMEEGGAEATVFGLYHAGQDRAFLLSLRQGAMEQEFGDKHPAAMRELDVVVLSDLILEKYLDLSHARCAEENLVEYFSDPDEALDRAVKESAAEQGSELFLFLMNPTEVSQVQRVADEGLVMPHKSTYFYPKILTGMVMNKMVTGEPVQVLK